MLRPFGHSPGEAFPVLMGTNRATKETQYAARGCPASRLKSEPARTTPHEREHWGLPVVGMRRHSRSCAPAQLPAYWIVGMDTWIPPVHAVSFEHGAVVNLWDARAPSQ